MRHQQRAHASTVRVSCFTLFPPSLINTSINLAEKRARGGSSFILPWSSSHPRLTAGTGPCHAGLLLLGTTTTAAAF